MWVEADGFGEILDRVIVFLFLAPGGTATDPGPAILFISPNLVGVETGRVRQPHHLALHHGAFVRAGVLTVADRDPLLAGPDYFCGRSAPLHQFLAVFIAEGDAVDFGEDPLAGPAVVVFGASHGCRNEGEQ